MYLQAAVNGSTVLAILIGAVIVGNTMLLSLFERTHEFGLIRAFGWTRRRMVALCSARASSSPSSAPVSASPCPSPCTRLAHLPALKGVLHPNFTEGVFWRALYTALGMTSSAPCTRPPGPPSSLPSRHSAMSDATPQLAVEVRD